MSQSPNAASEAEPRGQSGHRQSGLRPERFAARVLPWLIGAGALLVYALTLNPWVSLHSLGTVARVSGWSWRPELQQPLTFLVLYPFGLLPELWRPLALNLLTAACAGLVLALLARSIALLPHDRTHNQRMREESEFSTLSTRTAWMPPVLAAIACGLQLTFWEHATSITAEMIDLLVFACIIRGLLEFRIDHRAGWLSSAVFLYGASLAESWTMIAYLPAFLFALLRVAGLSLFSFRMLTRLTLWGLAGLSLYLLLPLLHSFSSVNHIDLWAGLRAELKLQKDALNYFPRPALGVLALTTLLPLLAISVRWRGHAAHSGDDNRLTAFLIGAMFHFVHALFLAASLWIMLDPPFSPRHMAEGVPLLSQYYLSALVVGYCAGYFLLIGAARVPQPVSALTLLASWLLLAALPAALVWRNFAQIRTTNGPALREFANELYRGLPVGKSVVLSDSPAQLMLLRGALGAHGQDKDPLLLDTQSLAWAGYHIWMARQFKSRWPVAPPTNALAVIGPGPLLHLVSRFGALEPLLYLHPSFSYVLEAFAARPNGLVQSLIPRPRKAPGPAPDPQAALVNEQYWQALWTHSLQTAAEANKAAPGRAATNPLADRLRLAPEQNRTARFLGAAYARSLNQWAVQLQRLGRWKEASTWLRRAVALDPANLAARINLEYNERYQAGDSRRLNQESTQEQFLDLFAARRNWEAVTDDCGTVDEPTFLFETGRALLARGKDRQAAAELARCAELAPQWLEPKLWLAQAEVGSGDFADALRLADTIQTSGPVPDGAGLAQLLYCRATALQGLGQTNEAAACVDGFVARHPQQAALLSVAVQLHLEGRRYESALALLDQLLKLDPNNPEHLSNKGLAEMQLARTDAAIASFTQALSLTPSNHVARLNRAIAFLRVGQLDAASRDYQELLAVSPNSYKVLFGLAEIAWRRQDTNAALRFYQQCSAFGIPDRTEAEFISRRLDQLQSRPTR